MSTGRQVRSTIEGRIAEALAAERSAAAAVGELQGDAQEVERSLRELVADLAALRHSAASEEVLQALGDVDREMASVVSTNRARVDALHTAIEGIGHLIAQSSEAQAAAAGVLADAEVKRDAEVAIVLDALANTDDYRSACARREAIVAEGAAAASEIDSLDAERSRFLAGAASPVHDYLRTAGYGSERYRGGWLVRVVDAWLANRSGFVAVALRESMFDGQRAAAVQRHNEIRSANDAADAQLHQMSAEAIAASSAAPLVAAAQAAAAALEQAEARLADLQSEHVELQDERAARLSGRDSASMDAVRRLGLALASASDSVLRRAAAETQTGADDVLVAKIVTQRSCLQDVLGALQDADRERERAVAVRREAEEVLRVMRSRSLLSSDSRYRGVDADALLRGVLAGSLRANDVVSQMARGHWEEPPYRPPPAPSRSSSFSVGRGGGFGGGRSSSGGGFGGGGRRTGGGF